MTHGKEIGCPRLGRVGQDVKRAAILSDAVVGHHDKRLCGNAFRQRRKVGIADDLRIQRGRLGIAAELHRAARCRLELRKVVLLRKRTWRDTSHVCHRNPGTVCECQAW